MSAGVPGYQYRRRCSCCGEHKLMAGGWTAPGGRRWVCAGCRRPPARQAKAA